MKVHLHVLRGCGARPLAAYLKALGVLRVISEQADPLARAYWDEERFVLLTRLDEQALCEFFLERWSPTPCVSPWNNGARLLRPDPKGVAPIEGSVAPRFEALRAGIRAARSAGGAVAAHFEASELLHSLAIANLVELGR